MVGISVGPDTAGECAEGVSLVLAILLAEELAIEHFSSMEFQAASAIDDVGIDYNLVEEIPTAAIDIRSEASVIFLPEGVVESTRLGLFDILDSAEDFRYRLIVWVVVQVAHGHDAYSGIFLVEFLSYLQVESGGSLAEPTALILAVAA